MEKYRFRLTVDVEVEAFDNDDAQSVITDFFGEGPMDDILQILSLNIKQK
ncbi:MAG TPA: hypothetical protein VFM18_10630 [Methanosarcina sp.]|nr:hypothetical protein [Methanosarcina sp.]